MAPCNSYSLHLTRCVKLAGFDYLLAPCSLTRHSESLINSLKANRSSLIFLFSVDKMSLYGAHLRGVQRLFEALRSLGDMLQEKE